MNKSSPTVSPFFWLAMSYLASGQSHLFFPLLIPSPCSATSHSSCRPPPLRSLWPIRTLTWPRSHHRAVDLWHPQVYGSEEITFEEKPQMHRMPGCSMLKSLKSSFSTSTELRNVCTVVFVYHVWSKLYLINSQIRWTYCNLYLSVIAHVLLYCTCWIGHVPCWIQANMQIVYHQH
jgi:hypothetical protein